MTNTLSPTNKLRTIFRMRRGMMSTAQLLSLAALLAGLPVALYLVLNAVRVWPKAAVTDPHVFFSPATASLPPNRTIDLKLDAKAHQIGGVRVEFTFDKTKVNLSGEITTGTSLATVVLKSTMAQANSTGRVRLAVARSTDDPYPTGTLTLALIPFTVVTTAANQTDTLIIDQTVIQIVDNAENALPFTTANATLTLNPAGATLTPTETPTPTPTPTPTATPTPPACLSTMKNLGDANCDCRVDGADYLRWLSHYQQDTSNGYSDGDFNESGRVDGADYLIWLGHYLQQCDTPPITPTPTPTGTTGGPSPVGWWKLDENTDNTCQGGTNDACDSSGNGNNGAKTNMEPDDWVPGKSGSALNFGGSDEYVQISNSSVFDVSAYTISGWIYPTNLSGSSEHHLFYRFNYGGQQGYGLYVEPDGRVGCPHDGKRAWFNTSGSYVSNGQWFHLACRYDGSTVKVFVNGAEKESTNQSQFTNAAAVAPRIGHDDNDYAIAVIDDVRVYNYALTPAQIAALYNQTP